MKITENYFVIRSPEIKKYVCSAHHGTETKLLKAAQRFDSKSEAESGLGVFISKCDQKSLNRIGEYIDEDWGKKTHEEELRKIRSFKVYQAERSFELKDEVPA